MAQYSTKLSDFVNDEKTKFDNPEEFYDHIDTAELKTCGGEKNGLSYHVKLEFACKGALRDMKWIDSKDYGVGYEVNTTCYIVTYEIEDDDNSMYTCLRYIYKENEADSAFEMMTKICNMLKA